MPKCMVPRGTNGVMNGYGLDRPTPGRVPVRVIFSVATALGFFSAFAAFYFVSTFTDKGVHRHSNGGAGS